MRSFGLIPIISTIILTTFSTVHGLPVVGLYASHSFDVADEHLASRSTLPSAPTILQSLASQVKPHIDAIHDTASTHNGTNTFFSQQFNLISGYMEGATAQLTSLRGNSVSRILSGTDDSIDDGSRSSDLIAELVDLTLDLIEVTLELLGLGTGGEVQNSNMSSSIGNLLASVTSLGIPGLSEAFRTNLRTNDVLSKASGISISVLLGGIHGGGLDALLAIVFLKPEAFTIFSCDD